jgi:hypothetical protein
MKYYKEKIINTHLYPAKIYFIKTNDEEKILKKHNLTFENHSIYAHTLSQIVELKHCNQRRYYLILDTASTLKIDHSTLAHECFHLSNMIFDFIGMIPSFEHDEPQAYLIQYLMKEGDKFFFGN